MIAQLSVLFPMCRGKVATRVLIFRIEVVESLDWVKRHADEIAVQASGRNDYTALYVEDDDEVIAIPKGA